MGALLKLLTSQHFRTRTGMWVGNSRFHDVSVWLRGFEIACGEFGENDLDGFYEWLMVKYPDSQANIGWTGIISEQFGDTDGTAKLFECIDHFIQDLSQLGLENIVQQHAEYERQRWGRLNVSRLLKRGVANG